MNIRGGFGYSRNKRVRRVIIGFCTTAVFVLLLLVSPSPASANNIYISQNGVGGGTSCNDTLNVAWFNTAGNWGSGVSQIGPGTTVHLCGTITCPTNSSCLVAQGSGGSGNPVTIKFELGSMLTSPAAGTFIVLDGQSFFVIDGGTTCGWVNTTLVPCNGVIQNTDNGTNLANHIFGTVGISGSPSSHIEIRNVAIHNMYVKVGQNDQLSGSPGPGCIHFYPSSGSNNTDWNVHNNTFDSVGWCMNGGATAINVANNDFGNQDHAFAMGSYFDGAGMAISDGTSFHDNHLHDFGNWDTTSNDFHHDGFHLFAGCADMSMCSNAPVNKNIYFYNNQIDGTTGTNTTAIVFFEGNEQNAWVFNNVGITQAGFQWNNGFFNAYGQNLNIFNNTVIGGGKLADTSYLTDPQGQGILHENNVLTDSAQLTGQNCSTSFLGPLSVIFSHNAYLNGAGNGFVYNSPDCSNTQFLPANASGFATWQSLVTGGDAGSILGDSVNTSSYLNPANGTLVSGSRLIGAGLNLTSTVCGRIPDANAATACTKDITGKQRASSGSWDMGAFSSGSSAGTGVTGTQPSAPTGLIVQVN